MDTVQAARWLRDATAPMAPTAWTYHPLQYAWAPHETYLRRFGGRKKALLVGMNPGPWGMGQNGIPFGDHELVGDWMGLRGLPIGAPPVEHPKRPVKGWGNTRREASGMRLWGHLRDRWGTPERALRDLLVANHCPLLLLDDAGRNVTPDKLPMTVRGPMLDVCDDGLIRMAEAVGAGLLVGVGKYAEERARQIAPRVGADVTGIPHPSPASPLANRNGGADWRAAVDAVFATI